MRFPEFREEWEKKKLEECVEFLDGLRKPIKSEDRKSEQGLYPYYGASGIIDYIDGYIFDGEYILLSEDGANIIDRNYRVAFIAKGKIWVNNHAHVLQPYDGFDINFLSETLERINYAVYNTGTTMPKLNQEVCRNINLKIPTTKEQNKIGNLLSLLNKRIATQSKIIEDLKKLKSAISKLLFTRKDLLETTIRLTDIATLKNGYAFQSSKYDTQGKWKILTIANVSGERYINDDDCNCIINLPNDIQDHQVLKEGDILISLTGNVGRVSLCKDGNYLLNQRVGLLHITKNVNQEFLYQVLSSRRFENSMVACGQGAAQMNIGKGDVENFVLPYSSNANNIHLVARILHSYDECIINELRELTLLTMQKQYLLQQMFI